VLDESGFYLYDDYATNLAVKMGNRQEQADGQFGGLAMSGEI
jgi:hypothetical protein